MDKSNSNNEPKPVLVIADNEGPCEGLNSARLYKNIDAGEIGNIIHARDAVKSQWGFRPEEVLEHLQTDSENYSAILINWYYRDIIEPVKTIVGDKAPIILFGFTSADNGDGKYGLPTATLHRDLSDVLHEELAKLQ